MEWWQRLAARLGVPGLIVRLVHPVYRVEASGIPPHMPGWFCETFEAGEGQRLFVCVYPPIPTRENLGRLALRLMFDVTSGVLTLSPNDTFYTMLVTPSNVVMVATETEWYSSEAGRPVPTATYVCLASENLRLCLPGGILLDGSKATIFTDMVVCLLDDSCRHMLYAVTRELYPDKYELLARIYDLMRRLIIRAYEVLGTDLDTVALSRVAKRYAVDQQLLIESVAGLARLQDRELSRLADELENALRGLNLAEEMLVSRAGRFDLSAFGLKVA